jgi:hypothetical protein
MKAIFFITICLLSLCKAQGYDAIEAEKFAIWKQERYGSIIEENQMLKQQLAYEQNKNTKSYDTTQKIYATVVVAFGLLLMLLLQLFYTHKLKPFIQESLSRKKQFFRLLAVLSFFWVVGWLLGLEPFRCSRFWCSEWKSYFILGLFPPVLFWSIYWIKSAKN